MNNPITVTKPFLPPLDEYNVLLQDIWSRAWLTNNGYYHQALEEALCKYLGVPYISLFANGTLALVTALQALGIKGEVITTPYSFVATSHSIWWNNLKPVFVDIEPNTFNIDPQKIEAAITKETTAILPVHVYGNPCNTDEIKKIADKHGLKVIYDAAHAFSVKRNGESILKEGDLSVLSFHATKVFSTVEGGAIISHTPEIKHHIDNLKNFGFQSETIVEEPGINAKLNELQAAFGLLSLQYVDDSIYKRKEVVNQYREALKEVKGISFLNDIEQVKHNYAYFPILIDESKYGISRDMLYEKLKQNNIFGRRYFYPLISTFEPYKQLRSSSLNNLRVANIVAEQVICLPLYPTLTTEDINRIITVLKD